MDFAPRDGREVVLIDPVYGLCVAKWGRAAPEYTDHWQKVHPKSGPMVPLAPLRWLPVMVAQQTGATQ